MKKSLTIRKLKRKFEEREEIKDANSVFDPNLQSFEKPKDIQAKFAVFSVDFAPKIENQLACSLVNGRIQIYEYQNNKKSKLIFNKKENSQSTRHVLYSKDGLQLYSCSADNSISIIDIETVNTIHKFDMAHNRSINKIAKYKENIIISGCDGGVIRLWDVRQQKKITTFIEHTDFISSFLTLPKKQNFVAASGDGLVSVYDMKKQTMYAVSDNQDDELLSLTKAKNDTKIIVGGQSGILMLFSYDFWGDCSDRLPVFRGNLNDYSLDSLLQLKDDRILVGSSDGKLRRKINKRGKREVSILPNRVVNTLGVHSKDLTVEDIKLSNDQTLIATCSYDGLIKFHSTIPIYGDPNANNNNNINNNINVEINLNNNHNITIEEKVNENNENENVEKGEEEVGEGEKGDDHGDHQEKGKNEEKKVEIKTEHHQFNVGSYQVPRKKVKRNNFFSGF